MNTDKSSHRAYTSEIHAKYIIKYWINDNLPITTCFFSKNAERFKFASSYINFLTVNSYLTLVGDTVDTSFDTSPAVPVGPPLPPHGVGSLKDGSIRRTPPKPFPTSPTPPTPRTSVSSSIASPRHPLGSDDSTQFHLDGRSTHITIYVYRLFNEQYMYIYDLKKCTCIWVHIDVFCRLVLTDMVPVLSTSPRRPDSGFSDAASFMYNDVFDTKECLPSASPSPKCLNLDQDIPLTVGTSMEDECSIVEEVLISSKGVKPIVLGAPPKPPPRPRHTLSESFATDSHRSIPWSKKQKTACYCLCD